MILHRIFTALSSRLMTSANGLLAIIAVGSATVFALVQMWQLRFSLVDLAPLGCIYLMTRSAHWSRMNAPLGLDHFHRTEADLRPARRLNGSQVHHGRAR